MARFTVGCVPYVNARPLVRWFQETGEVEVLYDEPSALPAMLDSGRAQAVLASSFEVLRTPGRTFAEGVSIASVGAVQSVRLFSRVPVQRIERLALDQSSLTSNRLALILLAELFQVRPHAEPQAPHLAAMLESFDAAVLIGDRGMAASDSGLIGMDLGSVWSAHTGLPFVWALWIGNEGLPGELVRLLNEAARWGSERLPLIATESEAATGMPAARCEAYLREAIDFRLTDAHLGGLRRYRDLLVRHGFLDSPHWPQAVGPTV